MIPKPETDSATKDSSGLHAPACSHCFLCDGNRSVYYRDDEVPCPGCDADGTPLEIEVIARNGRVIDRLLSSQKSVKAYVARSMKFRRANNKTVPTAGLTTTDS